MGFLSKLFGPAFSLSKRALLRGKAPDSVRSVNNAQSCVQVLWTFQAQRNPTSIRIRIPLGEAVSTGFK